MTVEVNGTRFILREISDQWGEESQTFLSRPEMMNWAEHRFSKEKNTPAEKKSGKPFWMRSARFDTI